MAIQPRRQYRTRVRPYHHPMASEETSRRVERILAAAERTAAELREHAEERVRERIAEAERAAANRVQAAEEEAHEILHAAQTQAESARNDALAAVGAIREETAQDARQQA